MAGGFTIDADKETGGSTINLTVDKTVNVGGVDLAGEQTVTVNNLASDLTTTNVKDLTVTLETLLLPRLLHLMEALPRWTLVPLITTTQL